MQTPARDKMIGSGDADTKTTEAPLREFHFAGGLAYLPQTVKARTAEEALEIWTTTRQPAAPSQDQPQPQS